MTRRTPAARRNPAERRTPEPGRGLDEEIDLLRRAVRRLFDLSQSQDDMDAVKTLNVLASVSARLARLVNTQSRLPEGDNADSLLAQALDELRRELEP